VAKHQVPARDQGRRHEAAAVNCGLLCTAWQVGNCRQTSNHLHSTSCDSGLLSSQVLAANRRRIPLQAAGDHRAVRRRQDDAAGGARRPGARVAAHAPVRQRDGQRDAHRPRRTPPGLRAARGHLLLPADRQVTGDQAIVEASPHRICHVASADDDCLCTQRLSHFLDIYTEKR
jgi:hypothetical protein